MTPSISNETITFGSENNAHCPTNESHPGDIVGCGSSNVTQPDTEGLRDCCACGIWFRADEAANTLTPVKKC